MLLAFLFCTQVLMAQTVITRWTFNSNPPDASVGSGDSLPAIGNGVLTGIGGVSRSYATGGGLDTTTADNSGLSLTGFPSGSANNKTAGLEIKISTVGFQDLKFSWSQRHSNTSGNTTVFQYCTDVTAANPAWIDHTTFRLIPDTNTALRFHNRSVNLNAITALNNNPNAGFRIVLAVDSATGNYTATAAGSNYGATGTWRFDWVTLASDTSAGSGGSTGGGGGNPVTTTVPLYNPGLLRGANTNGGPDSLGVYCRVRGVVHGINYRPAGLQFTIIDATGGMGVFRNTGTVNGYAVAEGDQVEVFGTVAVFRGLAQINADSIFVLSTGNALNTPTVVPAADTLNETHESQLIRLNGLTITGGTWPAANASANITVSNGTNSYLLRIVNATDIDGSTAPTGTFDLIGLGSQFAGNASPFVGGYQIQPRSLADILPAGGVQTSSVRFNQASSAVLASAGTHNINLRITPAATAAGFVKVALRNSAGTAYGTDYTSTPAASNDTITLSVAAGDTSARISLNIVNNNSTGQNDTVRFQIATVDTTLSIGATSLHTLVIQGPNATGGGVPLYTIAQVRGNNTNGGPDSLNTYCRIKGVVYGINFRPAGLQFTVMDATGGMGVFRNTGTVNNYTVTEGDEVEVFGTVATFRGLAQINADTIRVLSTGNPLQAPQVLAAADTLNETHESKLVRINGLTITGGTWPAANASANITVSNGTNSYLLRVVNATNIDGTPAPTGTFDLIGLGSQFAGSAAPFVGGYQIQPRSTSDIIAASNPTTGTVRFLSNGQAVAQTQATRTVDLRLAPAATAPVTVVVKAQNLGSVAYGTDYTTVPAMQGDSLTLTFAVGDTSRNFTVNIVANNAPNQTDSIRFSLSSLTSGVTVGTPSTHLFRITNPVAVAIPTYSIATLRGSNANGGPDSLGVVCKIRGVVYGINYRPAGLQFTVRDNTGGMGAFRATGTVNGYNVNEGDSVEVAGTVAVFRGLSQMTIDSIQVLGTNRPLKNPTVLAASDTLGEIHESDLVRINGLTIVSGTWPAANASANITVTNGTRNYVLRIVNATNIGGTTAPTGSFDLIGIGSQFSSTTAAPFIGGFQIQPRSTNDIISNTVTLSAFGLLTPANNSAFTIGGSPTSSLNATWNASVASNSGAVSYEFLIDNAAGNFTPPSVVALPSNSSGSATAITLTYAQINTLLTGAGAQINVPVPMKWTVRATSGSTTLLATTPFNITLTKGVFIGVNEKSLTQSVVMFPNPATSSTQLLFGFDQAQDLNISIVDLQGRTISRQVANGVTSQSINLNVENLTSGLYLVRIETANGEQATLRLIRN